MIWSASLSLLFILLCIASTSSYAYIPVTTSRYSLNSVPAISMILRMAELGTINEEKSESLIVHLHRLHRARNTAAVCNIFLGALNTDSMKPYDKDRISYNIALQALLRSKRKSEVSLVLQKIESDGNTLAADTVHILISDAFWRKDNVGADELFSKHFESGEVIPTLRSFNIMIEGHRVLGDFGRARQLFDLMKKRFGLSPDLYTFSSLIRMSDSEQEILDYVECAARDLKVTPPVARCAIESLGKLGCPTSALLLSNRYLSGNNSVGASTRSGDTIITALLSEDSRNTLVTFGGSSERADNVAFSLVGIGKHRFNADNRTASCGSKGFCLLFSHLYTLSESKKDGLHRGFDADLTRIRDELWKILHSNLILSSSSQSKSTSNPNRPTEHEQPSSSTTENEKLSLNGRLGYAILRCYSYDIEAARQIWKQHLLPIAALALKKEGLLQQQQQQQQIQELSEKAMEALMFSCGLCGRPDIGLEIAITVRKRKWQQSQMTNLSRRYFEGRVRSKDTKPPTSTSSSSPSLLLNRGLEASIMSELGAFDESELERAGRGVKFKTIRLKL